MTLQFSRYGLVRKCGYYTQKTTVKNLSVKNYSDLINNRRAKLVCVQTENISWEYIIYIKVETNFQYIGLET